jgi:hypothetical protein
VVQETINLFNVVIIGLLLGVGVELLYLRFKLKKKEESNYVKISKYQQANRKNRRKNRRSL